MGRPLIDQQKISLLVISELILVFIAMICFSIAVVYYMARLQFNIQETYLHPLAVSNAGLEAYANLSHLHNQMTGAILRIDVKHNENLDRQMEVLDKNLRTSFNVIKTEFRGETGQILEIERLMDEWRKTRLKIIDLLSKGNRSQAISLAMTQGSRNYQQLEKSMWGVIHLSHHRVDELVDDANAKSYGIIRIVWWILAGFILTSIVSGILVIRKISVILEHIKQAEFKLHASEERMKLALSGADIGTWDLYPATGILNFDSQWGNITNLKAEKERPHTLEEWAHLVHQEDRERALKAMQEHIDGVTPEYKAEYRIYTSTGKLKWVAGHGKAVSRDQHGKALRIVGITRDITIQKKAEDTIWKLAHTDSLTGLPNRALFYDRLGQAIAQSKRKSKKIALLFMDLDDFKFVNDNYGHDAGDALLREVAVRLRQNIRSENTVARTGGDEFMIILNDMENPEKVITVAKKIILSISEPFFIHKKTCLIGCSIGIAIFPDDSIEMDALVTHADSAMYQAKARGKNNFNFFTSGQ